MSYYTREELEIKGYEKLYEIAINEKLINIYSKTYNKGQLIDLILKYRENSYDKHILYKSHKGFYNIQNILDSNGVLSAVNMDIEIPREIIIYSNTNFSSEDVYQIKIDKNLNIDKNIVLLVGKNRYIYSIFSMDLLDYDKNYFYYKLNSNIVDRFENDYDSSEEMSLVFCDKYSSSILYKAYESIDYQLSSNLKLYNIKLLEFKYEIIKEDNSSYCPIIFSNNMIITNYFKKEFAMYVRKIENKKLYIEYFEGAIKSINNKDYIFYGSYIDNIKYLLGKDEKIQLFDDYSNYIYIEKKELKKLFINYLIEYIKSYSKTIFNKYYTIGIDLDFENFIYLSTSYILSYGIINKMINNTIESKKNKKFLIIYTNYSNISISTNLFNYIEKDINYDINIENNISIQDKNISYHSMCDDIFKILKFKICNKEYKILSNKEIISIVNKDNYYNFINKYERDYKLLENLKKTDFNIYKNKRNDEYLEIKQRYYFLNGKAKEVFRLFIENKNFMEYELDTYNIKISKSEIEMILCLKIYKFLNDYFKKYNTIELLNQFAGINLSGDIVKSNIFYNLIKEFIPGKLIELDDNIKNSNQYILEMMNIYIKSVKEASIKCNNVYNIKIDNLCIYVKDFKGTYQLLIDTDKNNFSYIDKIDSISTIYIKVMNKDTSVIKLMNVNVDKTFIEKDENDIKLNQIYLNNIENNIIRIFFEYDKSLNIYSVKREDDQIYISQKKCIDIEI